MRGGLAALAGALVFAGACSPGGSRSGAVVLDGSSADSAADVGSGSTCVVPGKDPLFASVEQALQNGRATFRFDTFRDEAFWGDTLKLHQAIAGAANGGVGGGLSP